MGSRVKQVVVWLAVRELLPAMLAKWIINRFGLRGA